MFILIVAALLGGIMAVALVSIKFLFSEHIAKRFYRLFALADLAIIAVIVGGWAIRSFVPSWFVSVFGNCATVFLTAQLLCGVFVICALVVRGIYRKLHRQLPHRGQLFPRRYGSGDDEVQ